MQDRVSAIIIKNKKLLLVTGYDESFYWTPGGKSSKESHKKTLIRELKEELNIKPTSFKPYLTYEAKSEVSGEKQKVHCYIISYKGKPKPRKEITKFFWYSKKNFNNKNIRISKGIEKYLIPKLIMNNLL